MGLLSDIYSWGDTKKRELKGLLADPVGMLEKTVGQLQDSAKERGSMPEILVVSPNHKTLFSAFASVAQNRIDVKGGKNAQATVVGGAEIYLSDFGGITVMPHYLMSGGDTAYLLNTDYLDLAFLDGFQTSPLAKTGDSEKIMITADCCLAVRAPTAQSKITNLTP